MRSAAAPQRLVGAERTPAEIYSTAWASMNAGIELAVAEDEVPYLKAIALGMDDDLASLLLLKKLRLAKRVDGPRPADVVGVNSFVEFRFGGGPRSFCQLLHPTVCNTSFAIRVDSRLGAGLVGLRPQQELLWPDESGCVRELHVIAVTNPAAGYARGKQSLS